MKSFEKRGGIWGEEILGGDIIEYWKRQKPNISPSIRPVDAQVGVYKYAGYEAGQGCTVLTQHIHMAPGAREARAAWNRGSRPRARASQNLSKGFLNLSNAFKRAFKDPLRVI